MISRVAENCFWLHRYVERAENTARMLDVNLQFTLDASLAQFQHWRPVVIAAGEESRFTQLVGNDAIDDGDAVQQYMVWDERNPVSLFESFRWARENARTAREAISLEMWECWNGAWLWLNSRDARRLYRREPSAFYGRVREAAQLFTGTCHGTMPHGEAYEFMRLGRCVERTGQTARILDVKYHALGPTTGVRETSAEAVHWIAILRSCSALESFLKRHAGAVHGQAVAEFLTRDPDLPRSVRYALDGCIAALDRIVGRSDQEQGHDSVAWFRSMRDTLVRTPISETLLSGGLHAELTRIVNQTAEGYAILHREFFDPSMTLMTRGRMESGGPGAVS